MARETAEMAVIKRLDCLIDKIMILTTELKVRNEYENKLREDTRIREREAMIERRSLILVIAVLAGINVLELVGVI